MSATCRQTAIHVITYDYQVLNHTERKVNKYPKQKAIHPSSDATIPELKNQLMNFGM